MSTFLVSFGNRIPKVEEGFYFISLVLIAACWSVITVYLRRGTKGGQLRGLMCLWVERTGAEAPGLTCSFVDGINNCRTGCGGAFVDRACVAPALSVIWCLDTLVIVDPGEKPK